MKLSDKERNAFRKMALILGISMAVFSLCCRLFFRWNGVSPEYRILLNDAVTGTLTQADGTVTAFEGTEFPAVRQGDQLELNILHPERNPYSVGTTLAFFVSNSLVEVYCGDQLVYKDSTEPIEQGIMPCNQFYTISLPPTYTETGLRILITPVDRSAFTSMDLWLSPNGHALKSILVHKEFSFLLLAMMMVIAFFAAIGITFLSISRRQFSPLILLALFSFLIIMWNLGAQGFSYLISDARFASQGEYLSLFATCIPLSMYMFTNMNRKFFRVMMGLFAVFFTVYFAYATVLNFSAIPASYNTLLTGLHIAIVAMMIVYLASIVLDEKKPTSFSRRIADYGFRACIAIGLVEFIRFNAVNYLGAALPFLRISLGPLAIAALVLTMILAAGFSYVYDYLERMEKEHLHKLAYQDNLTGIPNRSACYLELDKLVLERVRSYSMFFLDLNFLKKANDTYGHEVGDRMLILTAQAIKTVFENRGFYGRWGGDEFIACVPGAKEKGDRALEEFRKEVRRINETEPDLPYGLSIAVGRADSTVGEPIEPIDAINTADEQMYTDKKRMKAERCD